MADDDDEFKIEFPKGPPNLETKGYFEGAKGLQQGMLSLKENVRSTLGPPIVNKTAEGETNIDIEKEEDVSKTYVDDVNKKATEGVEIATGEQFFPGIKKAIERAKTPRRKAKLQLMLKRKLEGWRGEEGREKFEEKAEAKGWENVISPRADSQLKGSQTTKDEQSVIDKEAQAGTQAVVEQLKGYDVEKGLSEELQKQTSSRPTFKIGGSNIGTQSAAQAKTEAKFGELGGGSSPFLGATQGSPSGPFGGLSDIGKQSIQSKITSGMSLGDSSTEKTSTSPLSNINTLLNPTQKPPLGITKLSNIGQQTGMPNISLTDSPVNKSSTEESDRDKFTKIENTLNEDLDKFLQPKQNLKSSSITEKIGGTSKRPLSNISAMGKDISFIKEKLSALDKLKNRPK